MFAEGLQNGGSMEFENIIKLIETVSDSKLTSFSLEEDGTKISMEADRKVYVNGVPSMEGMQQMLAAQPVCQEINASQNAGSSELTQKKTFEGNVVASPLVGSFYAAPTPDSDAFVSVGDTVEKGQTLGIIEAMKLMNEIECEYDGVVKEILVQNGDIVEYGQPLFVIG